MHRPSHAPAMLPDAPAAPRARVDLRGLVFPASETLAKNTDSWCLTSFAKENASTLELKPYSLAAFPAPFWTPLADRL